jgi:hypothetical protein
MAKVKHFAMRAGLVLTAALVTPAGALAQNAPWTSAGSAGTVDEADTGIVVFNQGIATLSAAAAVGATLDIRYNVVAVDGVFGGDGIALTARFRDAGASERVILRLKRYSLVNGVTQTVLTLDSNAYPAAASFQTRSVGACDVGLDFFNNVYFVEAQLIRSGAGGAPQLGGLKVGFTLC